MAHPAQAAAHAREEAHPTQPTLSAVFDAEAWVDEAEEFEDLDDEDEAWCVDHGSAIEVMETSVIRHALAHGLLRPSQRVWRDGHPCWQPISEHEELMPRDFAHERTGRFDVPEQSGPRRIVRRTQAPAPAPAPSLGSRLRGVLRLPVADRLRLRLGPKPAAFFSSFFVGVLLGLLLFLPFASAIELDRVGLELGGQARHLLGPLAP